VDDILLCSPSKSSCETHTILLLNSLAHWRYWVSRNKAQQFNLSLVHWTFVKSGILSNTSKQKNHHTLNSFHRQKKGHSFFSRINLVF
jgi:predicted negative regulator of RcsB-dependent stress response